MFIYELSGCGLESRSGQFKNPGYALHFRLDRNQFFSAIMVFIREDNSSKLISSDESTGTLHGFFVVPIILEEITFRITWTY